MITKIVNEKMKAPVDFLRGYKDQKIPLYQGKASKGEMDENVPKDIEKIKKIKKIADKVEPTLQTIRNTIIAIKTAKAIASAARDAGKIGSALVPPVAAAGVVQEKIIEKVKEEIADASAALKNTDFLIKQLKALAIETIIALLAIKLVSKGKGSGKSSGDTATQNELDELVALSNAEDSNTGDNVGGVTTITRTTTSTGTQVDGGVGGGGY